MDRRTEIAFAIATLATGVRAVVHCAICLSSCRIGGSQSMKMALAVAACISWFALAVAYFLFLLFLAAKKPAVLGLLGCIVVPLAILVGWRFGPFVLVVGYALLAASVVFLSERIPKLVRIVGGVGWMGSFLSIIAGDLDPVFASSYFLSALPYLSVLVSLAVEDQRRRIDKRRGNQCQ